MEESSDFCHALAKSRLLPITRAPALALRFQTRPSSSTSGHCTVNEWHDDRKDRSLFGVPPTPSRDCLCDLSSSHWQMQQIQIRTAKHDLTPAGNLLVT